jgi:hypothetical protein
MDLKIFEEKCGMEWGNQVLLNDFGMVAPHHMPFPLPQYFPDSFESDQLEFTESLFSDMRANANKGIHNAAVLDA